MMNRIVLGSIVRAARVNPTTRSVAPYRWQSTKTAGKTQQSSQSTVNPPPQQGSNVSAAVAGGLTVLIGGYAWYYLSGTREVVGIAQDGAKKAAELKKMVKDNAGDPAETMKYLRTASATLIPGSAPFLGKVFDQVENIAKEHGDDVKKVFQETYEDFEKLTKEGSFSSETASKAVGILQKRVKQIQDLAEEAGGDAYKKLIADNPQLKEKISEQYSTLKEMVEKAKEKKPEAEKFVKETGSELAKIFQDNGISEKSVKKAQDLLKKKGEEAKKFVEDLAKDAKKK